MLNIHVVKSEVTNTDSKEKEPRYTVLCDGLEFAVRKTIFGGEVDTYDGIANFFDELEEMNTGKRFLVLKSKLDEVKHAKDSKSTYFNINRDNWPLEIPEEDDPVWTYENILELALDNIKEL